MVSNTVLSAHGKMALTLLFVFFGTWLFGELSVYSLQEGFSDFIQIGLNPLRTWWTLAFTWQDYFDRPQDFGRHIGGALARRWPFTPP